MSTPTRSKNAAYIRALKDTAILQEYENLKSYSFAGVYVVPSPADIRSWHGVVFVPASIQPYGEGIFKFVMKILPAYPDVCPRVFFLNRIVHPLVNYESGELDLSVLFSDWAQNKTRLAMVISFVKKVFFHLGMWEEVGRPIDEAFNPEAERLRRENPDRFAELCAKSVADSIKNQYKASPDFAIRFRQTTPEHEQVLERILQKGTVQQQPVTSSSSASSTSSSASPSVVTAADAAPTSASESKTVSSSSSSSSAPASSSNATPVTPARTKGTSSSSSSSSSSSPSVEAMPSWDSDANGYLSWFLDGFNQIRYQPPT